MQNHAQRETERQRKEYEDALQKAVDEAKAREVAIQSHINQAIEEKTREIINPIRATLASDTSRNRLDDLFSMFNQFASQQAEFNRNVQTRMSDPYHPKHTTYYSIDEEDEFYEPQDTLTQTETSASARVSSMANGTSSSASRTRSPQDGPSRPLGRRSMDDDDPDEDPHDGRKEKKKKDKKKKKKKKKKKSKKDKKHHRKDDDDPDGGGGSPPPSSSSSSSSSTSSSSTSSDSDDHRPSVMIRTKEADSIKLLPLPERAGQFRKWRLSTRRKVIAASTDSAKSYKWIKEVEDPAKTFDNFRDSGKFPTLDSKLGSAISDLAKGELGRRVTLATEKEDKDGRNVTGRQLLKLVYDYYRTDEYTGIVYDVSDLMAIKMKSDNPNWKQLASFRDAWDETLAGMEKEPGEDVLEAVFKQQVRHCHCLSQDIGIYDRAPKGDPSRTYKFLYESVERFLARKQSELNRSDIQKTRRDYDRQKDDHRGRSRERSAAPAQGGKGKDKNKKGKKDKKRRNSKGDSSRGSSNGSRRLNGKQKGGICYTWKNTGKCARNDEGKCGYEHPEDQRGSSSGSSSSGKRGNSRGSGKGGKGKGKGKGKKGKRSESPKHNKSKKETACWFYLRAKCDKGDNCEFGHIEEELKRFQDKKKDFQ